VADLVGGKKVDRVKLETLGRNQPFRSLMKKMGIEGREETGGKFGPEFCFTLRREDWLVRDD
jgi:hypothetical protein